MGADLYIRKISDPLKKKYQKKFEMAVKKRDKAKAEKTKERHQKEVEKFYDKMYEKGYFRDSYNKWNVLNKLGYSYWRDFPCFMKGNTISPEKAKTLLCLIKQRELDLSDVKASEDRKWFIEQKAELEKFLKDAIKLNSIIEASI